MEPAFGLSGVEGGGFYLFISDRRLTPHGRTGCVVARPSRQAAQACKFARMCCCEIAFAHIWSCTSVPTCIEWLGFSGS